MMENMRYLSVPEVVALHELIMGETGHAPEPLRSPGLLESAVTRPQNLAYYEGADLAGQAASLGVGISQNQPFLDGNKRTAYVVMLTFMEINGYTVDAVPMDIARHLVGVAERADDREAATDEFASWLRERSKRINAAS
jgi:death-on-curing protein